MEAVYYDTVIQTASAELTERRSRFHLGEKTRCQGSVKVFGVAHRDQRHGFLGVGFKHGVHDVQRS